MAAAMAVAVAIATGALATRASAATAGSTLIGMAPSPASLIDKNSTAALKQRLEQHWGQRDRHRSRPRRYLVQRVR